MYYAGILLSLYLMSFLPGLFVTYKNFSVHYARKIFAIGFFLITTYFLVNVGKFMPTERWLHLALGLVIPAIWVISFLEPVRNRFKFLKICFSAFDRPEDRPYTIAWVVTGMVAGYIAIFFMVEGLRYFDAVNLITMTVFISVFGDGLAEPVGYKFGRHKYKTRALFTKRLYERSWEGSTCVFLSAIAIILAMYHTMTFLQLIYMLILMPPLMTLTEAKSPHTWDNPFMHLAGGLVTMVGCYLFGS